MIFFTMFIFRVMPDLGKDSQALFARILRFFRMRSANRYSFSKFTENRLAMRDAARIRCRLLIGLAGILLLPGSSLAQRDPLEFHQQQYQKKLDEFRRKLDEIAKIAEQNGYVAAADKIRTLAAPIDPEVLQSVPLPEKVQGDLPPNLAESEKAWRVPLQHAREQFANDLYYLSRRALTAKHPTYAYRLIQETARHNPDHVVARRMLGYVRAEDDWVTPYAAKQRANRYVWHEKYGWLLKTQVERYDQGQRFYEGRWMPAEREAGIRQDFDKAWEVRTENFLIKTNYSLEEGVQLAIAMEEYHQFFQVTFAAFFQTPEQIEQLFSGAVATRNRPTKKPHVVHFYRSQQEYIQRLQSKFPQIAITNGLYNVDDRISHFYHDPASQNRSTMYHEATHQMFYETDSRDRHIAPDADFWIVEGIACYMESLQKKDGQYELGNPRHIRFDAARYRLLNDRYYVKLASFSQMGMKVFQADPNIARNYSQASGQAHFFMHYENGKYREALIEHLSQIYRANLRGSGVLRVQTLAELTQVSFAELDDQYIHYCEQQENALRAP